MRWLRGLYLDLRSVALFRIALGLSVIADILFRIPQIEEFYTDRGIMPREAIFGSLRGTWAVSLHFISGQWPIQLILFLATLVLAAGMVLGYRTRLCTAGCWFLVMSMQVRNPLILHAGDDLLRMLLFWSMFLPLNGRYSMDRALNPTAPEVPVALLSPGSLALLFQICAVYWYTAAEKMHPIWLTERSAVYYALSLDQFATSFGQWLLQFPSLLRVLTGSTLVLEMLGPLLAISPVMTGPLRLMAVGLFLSFHTGLGLSLHLGLFPWVCVAAWLLFLPGMFWDFVQRRLGRGVAGATVFFDAGCGFCRKSVLILRELLLLDGVELKEAQSDPTIHARMREGNSWVVRDAAGTLHSGYNAFVALCRASPVGRWAVWLLRGAPARAVGERVYRWISSDRDRASRRLAAVTPPPPRLRLGLAGSLTALMALVLVEAVLARRPTLHLDFLQPGERKLVSLGALTQLWRMFAPYPNKEDGWFVMEGITRDGRRIDIWDDGGEPSYAKPEEIWALYRNSQWQKYLTNLWLRRNRRYRRYFGSYLCRDWNQRHEGQDRVDLVYVKYMLELTPPPGESPPSPTKESILRHNCADTTASAIAATSQSRSSRP